MSLVNRLSHSFKKNIILPAAILASSFLQAQTPPDTTYGQGNLEFLHNGNPIENVQTRMKAVAMTDSVIPTEYFGLSDANGLVPFDVPTSIDYHISLPENATLQDANVFPVPGNEANIILPNYDNYNLNLFDLSGRQLKHEEFNGTNHLYTSLADLPTGPYILQVTNDNGEVVHRTKTIKVAGAVNGPRYIDPAQLNFGKTNDFAKVQANATYRLWFNPPQGYVSDSTDISISDGLNGNIPINLNPWDTGYTDISILLRDNQNVFARFVPVTLTLDSMEQTLQDTTWNDNSGGGGGFAYFTTPIAVDTTGNPATTPARLTLSWPETVRHSLDSTTVTGTNSGVIGFEGWYAGDTSFTINPGVSPNLRAIPKQKPLDERIGKAKVRFELGKFDKYFNQTNADSTLIVVENLTQNSTDSIWTDSLGNATSDWYNHQDDLRIGAGYPGGFDANGNSLKAYTNIDVLIDGMTYFDIANQDSISETIQANLLPDSVYIQGIDTTIAVPAFDIIQMDQYPSVSQQKDTLYYYIHLTSSGGTFTPGQEANIVSVADSASKVLPLEFVRSMTPLANTGYPNNYSTTSHGANIFKGTNNIANLQTIGSNIKGTPIHLLTADVFVSGSIDEIWKELVYQYHAFDGVPPSHRPSVMNGINPPSPTLLDFGVFYYKHFVEKEMFKGTTPASNGTPTQNIALTYSTDSNNISSQ